MSHKYCHGIYTSHNSVKGNYYKINRHRCVSEPLVVCKSCNNAFCQHCYFDGIHHKCLRRKYGSQIRFDKYKPKNIRSLNYLLCLNCSQFKLINFIKVRYTDKNGQCTKCYDKEHFKELIGKEI